MRKEGVGERERKTKRWEDVWMKAKFHSVLQNTRQRGDEKKTGGEAPCESKKRGLEDRKTERKKGAVICRGPASWSFIKLVI